MPSSSPLIISLTLVALLGVTPARAADSGIVWQDWSETAFAQAKRENRFVLLDLGAVWCHWCHVMERDTYGNPAVADLIKARYVPVRVDQDARPDLSRRYEDYGWPATVVFSADGREIVKLRGYVPASRMISMLEYILADPSPITYGDSLFISLIQAQMRGRPLCPSRCARRSSGAISGPTTRGAADSFSRTSTSTGTRSSTVSSAPGTGTPRLGEWLARPSRPP